MRAIELVRQFRKDFKRETKGRSAAYVAKLKADLVATTKILAADGTLDDRYRDHALTGEWKDHRDCHVRPDLVLIYRKPDDVTLELIRLGSPASLAWPEMIIVFPYNSIAAGFCVH